MSSSLETNIKSELNKSNIILNEDTNKNPLTSFCIKFPKGLKIHITPEKKYISLCPMIPIEQIDIFFKLYDFKKFEISQEKIKEGLDLIINGDYKKKELKNGIEVEITGKNIKITDKHFINDCLIMSKKIGNDNDLIIANKISNCLFNMSGNFKYSEDKKRITLKLRKGYNIISDICENEKEAKKNVLNKLISLYLPEKESKEILKNISESIKMAEKQKEEGKNKFEKYLKDCGGDRKLLQKKRKLLTYEEFESRLPYFNMLGKNNKNKDSYEDDDDESSDDNQVYFINTENIPIDQILLGDLGIVDYHLNDFKYTPLKLFEMLSSSEKSRGIDFSMNCSQVNDKNYCHNNEATIFSKKLGIKVKGCGKSQDEAKHKCALKCLYIIFKDNYKTYYDLHKYFERKNGKYLDVILLNSINDNNNMNKYKKKKDEEYTINLINDENEILNNNDDLKTENVLTNFNANFTNNQISEINNSSYISNNNSVSSKELIEALSSQENKMNDLDESDFFMESQE